MEKEKFNLLLSKLETLAEAELGQLQGGFVSVVSSANMASEKNVRCEITNNCNGGNCVVGCGTTPPPPGG